MKKKFLIFACFLSAFFLLSGFSFSFGKGIDRSEQLKYKVSRMVNVVYVNLQHGNVYHAWEWCNVEEELLGIKSFIEITEYEAVLRGFIRCPDCMEIAKQSTLYSTSKTVDTIYYNMD